ncbi:rod shape-determining protein [Streptomyces sp. NPDC090046]|uniref:rod shape-determining protein n=1 Tax=Streptomyces sp. NPDC090046 TaxID=3365928 RepID=UPI00382A755F
MPAGTGGRTVTAGTPFADAAASRTGHRPWPLCRQCCGVALELGSARTRAWVAGRGMLLDVPTVTFTGAKVVHPVRRGAIVDVAGTARMLDRLLRPRLPRRTRPLVVITTPVLDGPAHRERARTAAQVLRPRTVLTVPAARAIALTADADLTRPLLVVDVGAHLTEVVLLGEGAVVDARCTALGTTDPTHSPDATGRISETVAQMITSMVRQDPTGLAARALERGALLAGGGALVPDLAHRLTDTLRTPLRVAPAPHTAALRGAAKVLRAAHSHPSLRGR